MDVARPVTRPSDLPLFHPHRRQGRAYRQLRAIVRGYLRTCHSLTVENIEQVPLEGPVILAGNHPSMFDPLSLFVACPRRIAFMAAEWTFRAPVLKSMMAGTGMIMVERTLGGAPALRTALKLLKHGWAVGIYPHGELVEDEEETAAKEGVVLMAASSGAPIVPVRTFGTDRALPRGMWVPRPVRPVRLAFGEPLTVTLNRLELKDKARVAGESQRVMDAIMGIQ
ncbi:MAG TPA: lysophospholipid acyltransferase family protein [bacterium]|nr:lysophospholipid acyltransferase family protein [bacterium]